MESKINMNLYPLKHIGMWDKQRILNYKDKVQEYKESIKDDIFAVQKIENYQMELNKLLEKR